MSVLDATRSLPVVVAGAGPAGAATAIGLRRAGVAALVFEARGPVATRARNIFIRPQARAIMRDLVGSDPGRDTTIRAIENSLRSTAAREGVPISYGSRITDVVDHGDHVAVQVQRAGADAPETVRASLLVDATGGRLPATNVGELERVPVGRNHMYVTAQYDTPVEFRGVYGAYDRGRNEIFLRYPVDDGAGSIAYYDLPPGQQFDEATALAKFDAIAGRLQLGTPTSPPQAFDAQQHLARSATAGRVLKLGDSAGNADPYIGAGVAAALVDARTAVTALTRPGDPAALLRAASDDVLAGHRSLGRQAQFMLDVRDLAFQVLPHRRFDDTLQPDSLRRSRVLDAVAATLTNVPIRTHA